jgi:cardiolipin synthase
MHRIVRHLPNILTMARAASLPFIVWTYALYHQSASWTTAWIVLFAALSDVADGRIARRYHVQSELGRWVDPIVDRCFFFTLVAMLWYFGTLPWWAVLPLLIRDAVILALAVPMRRYTDQGPQVSRWGRLSNFILICAVQWFIIDVRAVGWVFWAVGASLYVAAGLLYGYRAVLWATARTGRPGGSGRGAAA